MKIEKTEIWITCERPLTLFTDTDTVFDGNAVRGFLFELFTPELFSSLTLKLIMAGVSWGWGINYVRSDS